MNKIDYSHIAYTFEIPMERAKLSIVSLCRHLHKHID